MAVEAHEFTALDRAPRGPTPATARRRRWTVGAVGAAALGALAWTALGRGQLTINGIADGAVVRPNALSGGVTLGGASAGQMVVTLDGNHRLTPTLRDGKLHLDAPNLPEGPHMLRLEVTRRLRPDEHHTIAFTVDATPPSLRAVAAPVLITAPFELRGKAEPDATITVDQTPVKANADGSFTYRLDSAPLGPVQVSATDGAGNVTTSAVAVNIAVPATHGVHITALGWASDAIRQRVLDMIDVGQIDTVQLDIKDESGEIGYDSKVPLALEIGAAKGHYDVAAAIAELHSRGVRVVGRVVAFRDPLLASAAWARGDHDWVLQNTNGQPLDSYGGFTNYVNPDVRRYNLDIAVEAASAGFDDILWDYMRRPEGAPSSMVVPGLTGRSSDHIVSFMAEAHARLRPHKVIQGVSVFGIAASRPQTIAQDVAALAAHVEYVSPMVYPSHWNKGEYGVVDPTRQPGEIVTASLTDFKMVMAGSGAQLVPWLQDFTLNGVPYGATEVRAQMDAAKALGITNWLQWNPSVNYTRDAYDKLASASPASAR
jgi:hypothetical protein